PNQANAGGPAFTLTVNGNNFVNNSIVRWNGSNRPTTFISATQLTAMIPASDIADAGTASVTVFTQPHAAGAGGGASNAVPCTINQQNNPAPILNSLNPNPVNVGGQGFVFTVIGSNFVANSTVRINGANRPTTFVSATQLTAMIPASDIASAGTAGVTVFNPAPGGGTSNAAQLNIVNSAPAITAIFPNSVVAGSAGFTLTINGTGFTPASIARWNGANRQTSFISSTQLNAAIPASDVQSVGVAGVAVTNPAPGGGNSNTVSFTVTPQP